MKNTLIFLLALVFFSCNTKAPSEKLLAVADVKDVHPELYGSWVGNFAAEQSDEDEESDIDYSTRKINLIIKKITDTEVIGQSIVSGNIRPLKGIMVQSGNTMTFILKEPGDNKFDGEFTFQIKNDTLSGDWLSFNKTIPVPKRSYSLEKKTFVYDPKLMLSSEYNGGYIDYTHPKKVQQKDENGKVVYEEDTYRFSSTKIHTLNASTQKMVEDTLKNLKKLDLEIIRNTIYARHGYSFKKRDIRQFFDHTDWYIPVSNNVDKQLTPLEKQNIAMLERFEKYATDNYETFGR
ncbi:MAG: YARHG domain-containing protein [Flavobacterium sp.]|nr:YARHG domain-containing protein [Flavobacterium sp.]